MQPKWFQLLYDSDVGHGITSTAAVGRSRRPYSFIPCWTMHHHPVQSAKLADLSQLGTSASVKCF